MVCVHKFPLLKPQLGFLLDDVKESSFRKEFDANNFVWINIVCGVMIHDDVASGIAFMFVTSKST